MNLAQRGAVDLAQQIATGAVRAEEATAACVETVAAHEADVGAFEHFDAAYALEQARALDRHRASGAPVGPLHGVPVAIKDIVDTADFPTENGCALDSGRRPRDDAVIVARLRAAGAVILGKAVTTELAVFTPGKTRNPHALDRTPGGSSSGSAAAVAAGMVPLAIGTQTNGSVIRPAAFCGVIGFKPSQGVIPRTGVLRQAPSLDTVGVFAQTIEDAALLTDCIAGHDAGDPATRPTAPPRLLDVAREAPPATPALAFVRTPVWDQADEETRDAFAELVEVLGDGIDDVDLPEPFDQAHAWHRVVMLAEMAKHFAAYYERDRSRLSDRLVSMIEEGRTTLAQDYLVALDWIEVLNAGLDRIFERYDAIVTPAAPGVAPRGLDSTGNPAFCTIWTFCGVPAITLPLLESPDGLPLGVQLVGRRGDDARLLRTARWLIEAVSAESGAEHAA